MSLKNSFAGYALALVLTCATLLSAGTTVFAQADQIPTDEQAISNGKALFEDNCTVCHSVHERVVGPALKQVIEENRSLPWIISFVQNSQKVIQSGDKDAVALYNEFNKTEMPSFAFSPEQITSIVAYIKHETENPPVKEVAEVPEGGTGPAVSGGTGVSSEYLTILLVVLLVVLVLILIVLALIVSVLTGYLKKDQQLEEADREIVESKFDLQKLLTNKAFLGFVVFAFTAIVLKTVIDGLFMVGIQQNYQPKQPIAFSHKIHAGQMEIDCNYCHTGVRKSKSANIPSANICMNCHTEIKKDSPEIQKIYAALENDQPIEWVRIHNLPDLAYFNHSQHVKVGEVECQTCHGPIETMDVVYQYADLTMGWCINCHRETELNTEGNDYYTKLVQLHNEHSKEPMKVVDIGGLECAKCHY
ncbi:c-type cytochrome [Cytophagales bacterium RKSG123]|nr:c-type cytochrome [Xanthovirga aplysinae]